MSQFSPERTESLPVDCADPIPLSTRHWYIPWSSPEALETRREEPKIWRRADGMIGAELNSHVILGEGFPFATQVKRTEDPAGTDWSVRPCVTTAGSVEET